MSSDPEATLTASSPPAKRVKTDDTASSPPAKRVKTDDDTASSPPAKRVKTDDTTTMAATGDQLLHALRFKKEHPKAVLPTRATAGAAGYDISSAEDKTVPARGKALVATGLKLALPEGTYARIAPRSGLAWKHSIDTGAGVIDADYRGEVGVILFNHADTDYKIEAGNRIAQLILERIATPEAVWVEELGETLRGAGGFGSTGKGTTVQ